MESQGQVNPVITESAQAEKVAEIMEMIGNLNLPLILFSFLFYFLAGYLMYSSLLGAVGAAVDNDEDSQQMVFPVTFPLILSIMLLFPIARNPEGQPAGWQGLNMNSPGSIPGIRLLSFSNPEGVERFIIQPLQGCKME